MYNFAGRHYIDLNRVYLIEPFDSTDNNYPYGLRVYLLNDNIQKSIIYASKCSRDDELYRMLQEKDSLEVKAYQATMDEIGYTVKKEMRLCRDDIRVLKKWLFELVNSGGQDG